MRFRNRHPIFWLGVTFGSLPLAAPAIAADAPPAASAAAPTTPPASAALSPEQLSTQVTLFTQLNALDLTPAQNQDIVTRLTALLDANQRFETQKSVALKPVAGQLQRIHDALLAGQAADAGDLTAVETATAPIRTSEARLEQLRTQTVMAIRQQLTGPQLQLVRSDTTSPGDTSTAQAAGQAAGGGGAQNQNGGVPWGGPAAGGFGGGFGGGGGNPGGGPAMIAGMLDRLRAVPEDQYAQFKDRVTAMVVQRMGIDPNSPQFATTQQNLLKTLDSARHMTDQEWQQNRTQFAGDLIQQFNLNNVVPGVGGPTVGGAATGARDDAAIRKLFLQLDTLRFLQSKQRQALATP